MIGTAPVSVIVALLKVKRLLLPPLPKLNSRVVWALALSPPTVRAPTPAPPGSIVWAAEPPMTLPPMLPAAELPRMPPLSVTLPVPVAEPEEFPATNMPALTVVAPV